jgi:hypothetical protein
VLLIPVSLPRPGRVAQPLPRSSTVSDERETLTYELFGTASRELPEH